MSTTTYAFIITVKEELVIHHYKYSELQIGTSFQQKILITFLFLHENIYCGYSLEASH